MKTKYKVIEIACTATDTVYNFPTDSVLKNSVIVGVEAFSVTDNSITPLGRTVVNTTVFGKSYLMLKSQNGSEELISNVPLSRIRPAANNGDFFETDIDPINPSDCQIKVASSASLSASESFLIGVYYQKC